LIEYAGSAIVHGSQYLDKSLYPIIYAIWHIANQLHITQYLHYLWLATLNQKMVIDTPFP
jgi:hypothetical protein